MMVWQTTIVVRTTELDYVDETIVGEKMADGQLSECSLTMGDLTAVKASMVDALNGHYHQRIPYPNFPDASAVDESPETPDDDDSEPHQPASDTPAEQPAE